MTSVTIQVANHAELLQLIKLVEVWMQNHATIEQGNTNETTHQTPMETHAAPVQAATEVQTTQAAKTATKGKRGRPPKAKPAATNTPTAASEVDVGGNGSVAYSKEDTVLALKKVNTVKGIAVAKASLEQFSCKRISDLQPAQYPQFMEVCKLALSQ